MPECKDIYYKGRCSIGGKEYTFSKAELSDAAGISRIYEQTRIDGSNYRTRLAEDSPDRFEVRGGMFIVMDEREIGEKIVSDDSFWALFKDEDGDIAGSFWFCERNGYYDGLEYAHIDDCIYPREVVVPLDHGGGCIAQALYLTCSRALLQAGYLRGAADLYRVVRYETAEGTYTTHQTNIPSQRAVEAVGAVFAEPLPLRTLCLDGLTVTIEPQMYLFDYARIADTCEQLLSEKDIRIIRG